MPDGFSPLTWYRHQVRASKTLTGQSVPCGACTACCQKVTVTLQPSDDPRKYRTTPDGTALAQIDGRCAHLEDDRCTVYTDRPLVCRLFDCRALLVTGITAPAHVAAAAREKFAVLAKAPGDAEWLTRVRAHAAGLLTRGTDPAVALQASLTACIP